MNKNVKIGVGVGVIAVVVAVIIAIAVRAASKNAVDIEFFDGYIPGATYNVKLNSETKALDIVAKPGCSIAVTEDTATEGESDGNEAEGGKTESSSAEAQCPDATNYNTTLDDGAYDLTVESFEAIKKTASAKGGDWVKNALDDRSLLDWTYALIALNVDDGIYADRADYGDEWDGLASEDANNDGKVTGREHGVYTLQWLIDTNK